MSIDFTQLMNFYDKLEDMLMKNRSSESIQTNKFVKLTKMKQIDFPEIYGVTGGTHPSVKHFPDKWNGYEYWMAYTPYPRVDRENPVIVCSNNGYDWVTPSGLTNPIDPTPETGYNSDTELVYYDGKLYCYWRWYTDQSGDNIVYRMESEDGGNWTNKTACEFPSGLDPLSPTIVVDWDGNWECWIGANRGSKMKKLKSNDGITFDNMIECDTSIDDYGAHWHTCVWKESNYYLCLSSIRPKYDVISSSLGNELYFGWSKDGENWTFEDNPLVARGEQGLKKRRVYRSCAVRTGDHFKLYISGLGGTGEESEQIHVLEAKLLDLSL